MMEGKPGDGGGLKFDDDKVRTDLVAWDLVEAAARVLMFGARKYKPYNWLRGMEWHKPKRAAVGHIESWWNGEENDPESGLPHLWHAVCCLMFLIVYKRRGIGTDDRPKFPPRKDGEP